MSSDIIVSLSKIGHMVDERFEFLEAIDSGGMGTVFKGIVRSHGRLIALHMLHRSTESTRR